MCTLPHGSNLGILTFATYFSPFSDSFPTAQLSKLYCDLNTHLLGTFPDLLYLTACSHAGKCWLLSHFTHEQTESRRGWVARPGKAGPERRSLTHSCIHLVDMLPALRWAQGGVCPSQLSEERNGKKERAGLGGGGGPGPELRAPHCLPTPAHCSRPKCTSQCRLSRPGFWSALSPTAGAAWLTLF